MSNEPSTRELTIVYAVHRPFIYVVLLLVKTGKCRHLLFPLPRFPQLSPK